MKAALQKINKIFRGTAVGLILAAGIAWGIFPPTPGTAADSVNEYLSASWGKLTSALSETLDLRDKHESLPDSVFFGEDKGSNAEKINALLNQAGELLLKSETNDLRLQAIELRSAVPALQIERDKLRNKMISAPESSKLPWVATRSEIAEQIAELEADIKSKQASLSEINASIARELRGMGLEMDTRQIDIFLTSVTGDDLLRNTIIFANVKLVVEKLAELSREDSDNLDINRRYTGMYLVLNDLLIVTQEGLIGKIDGEYKPRLAEIRAEAEKLYAEASERSRQEQYPGNQREAFRANAEANSLTIRAADLYSELLENQLESLRATLQELYRSRDVAENTYRTVRSTGDLRNLIRNGLDLFDSIRTLSMPQIRPFENDTIRKEFEEINKRLRD